MNTELFETCRGFK